MTLPRLIAPLFAAVFLFGCSSHAASRQFPQVPSHAISPKADTSLGRAVRAEMATYPGLSGFRLMETGSSSFAIRLAMIQAAEKSLDLQYYAMHDDTTANLLLEAVRRAAQRGVRVRFLLDNIAFDEVDASLSVLDGMKNVEVRVFNPTVTRDDGIMSRIIKYTTDLKSMNRRMHNKMLISDNQLAITGGRNLGDEYFEENTDTTFRDLDILAAGPITYSMSESFDRYWNSKDAVPVGQLEKPRNGKDAAALREALTKHWNEVHATEKGHKLLSSKLHERLKDADVKMTWAKAELAVDPPQKVNETGDNATSSPFARLDVMLDKGKKEFIAVSPYFVPQEEGVEWIKGLIARGMKVRVLTNSLASTDVVAVHTGYRPYRRELLKAGTELYEMRPVEGKRPQQRLIGSSAPAHASLHSKVYVVDRKDVMIGSFNLDPRSISLNTEVALIIHSPEIAAQVVRMFDEVTAPEQSYELALSEDGDLLWKTTKDGADKVYTHEPEAGLWRNIQAGMIGLLPIEEHL